MDHTDSLYPTMVSSSLYRIASQFQGQRRQPLGWLSGKNLSKPVYVEMIMHKFETPAKHPPRRLVLEACQRLEGVEVSVGQPEPIQPKHKAMSVA